MEVVYADWPKLGELWLSDDFMPQPETRSTSAFVTLYLSIMKTK